MTELISYEWRLREQMAGAGTFHATKLMPELEARGIHLSRARCTGWFPSVRND
jgi:hypothetical protein